MQRIEATKGRLYPNKTTQTKVDKTLDCCRYVYNVMLGRNQKVYERRREHLSYNDMQNLLPVMKRYLPWLAEADSQALKYACRQLDTAYQKFFKHEAGFPRFHSKRGRQSYTTTNASTIHISDDCKQVKLPTLGWVKVRGLRVLPDGAKICYATVSREPDGSYYVSITYKFDTAESETEPHEFKSLGLDYKSNGLYVDSEGKCAEMPHYYRESQAKLIKEQRILSRRHGSRKGEKKSSGWKKQQRKVARLQRHIANQRKDYLHKESKRLSDSYDLIVVEDLNMRSMSNKGFGNGKATLDNGYGMFLTMLDYKLSWNGKQLVKVDKWYPSSQICHVCGTIDPKTKDLSVRRWTCQSCGTTHDRDVNAAINIRIEGHRMIGLAPPVAA